MQHVTGAAGGSIYSLTTYLKLDSGFSNAIDGALPIDSQGSSINNTDFIAGGGSLEIIPNGDSSGLTYDNLSTNFGNGTSDSPFSFALWFKFDSLSGTQNFISKRENLSTLQEWYIAKNTSNLIFIRLFSSSSASNLLGVNATVSAKVNVWTHLAFTYAGGAITPKIYTNGTNSSGNRVESGTYVAMSNTGAKTFIGRHGAAANTSLIGKMDEIAVANREWSASEVADIYNKGLNNQGLI